jgi:hypothetical protein
MAQRISRAKQSTKASGVPFHLPTSRERTGRLRRPELENVPNGSTKLLPETIATPLIE